MPAVGRPWPSDDDDDDDDDDYGAQQQGASAGKLGLPYESASPPLARVALSSILVFLTLIFVFTNSTRFYASNLSSDTFSDLFYNIRSLWGLWSLDP